MVDPEDWKINYKAMNFKQLERQFNIIKSLPLKYINSDKRLSFIESEMKIKAGLAQR